MICVAELKQDLKTWRKLAVHYENILVSISKNACCGSCKEAKLVAVKALADAHDILKEADEVKL